MQTAWMWTPWQRVRWDVSGATNHTCESINHQNFTRSSLVKLQSIFLALRSASPTNPADLPQTGRHNRVSLPATCWTAPKICITSCDSKFYACLTQWFSADGDCKAEPVGCCCGINKMNMAKAKAQQIYERLETNEWPTYAYVSKADKRRSKKKKTYNCDNIWVTTMADNGGWRWDATQYFSSVSCRLF